MAQNQKQSLDKPKRVFGINELVFVVCFPGALIVWTRPSWPADLGHRAAVLASPVLMGLSLVLAVCSASIVVLTHLRGLLRGPAAWRYRRRWARVLHETGLTRVERGEVRVPKLSKVAARAGADVLRVQMLDSQSQREWQAHLPTLAHKFGVAHGNLRLIAHHPGHIEICFTRQGPVTGKAAA